MVKGHAALFFFLRIKFCSGAPGTFFTIVLQNCEQQCFNLLPPCIVGLPGPVGIHIKCISIWSLMIKLTNHHVCLQPFKSPILGCLVAVLLRQSFDHMMNLLLWIYNLYRYVMTYQWPQIDFIQGHIRLKYSDFKTWRCIHSHI